MVFTKLDSICLYGCWLAGWVTLSSGVMHARSKLSARALPQVCTRESTQRQRLDRGWWNFLWAIKPLLTCVLEMATAESDGLEAPEAILFNGTNPKNENENLLIKYFPQTGVEEEIGKFVASQNNSMICLDGKLDSAVHSLNTMVSKSQKASSLL